MKSCATRKGRLSNDEPLASISCQVQNLTTVSRAFGTKAKGVTVLGTMWLPPEKELGTLQDGGRPLSPSVQVERVTCLEGTEAPVSAMPVIYF